MCMQKINQTLSQFLGHIEGPSDAGDCCVDAYLKDVQNKWSTHHLEVVPGLSKYMFNTDGFNVYLLHAIGPDGEYELAGFYHGGTVGIFPKHRGKGLGIETVLKAAIIRGGSPFNGIESHAFSIAGWRMHLKAYNVGIAREMFHQE